MNLDLSSKQACDLYDCSRATLANWVKNGLPKSKNGYPLKNGVHWHIKRQSVAGSDKDSKYWQKEFRKFKAQLAEIDLKIKRGDLVAHTGFWKGRCIRCKGSIMEKCLQNEAFYHR